MKVLDRFAIDYALCMYCGICVEVCPFDALFWSPEFEYAEYDIVELTHEKEKLEEWTYTVLPPPMIEEGAEVPVEDAEAPDRPAAGGVRRGSLGTVRHPPRRRRGSASAGPAPAAAVARRSTGRRGRRCGGCSSAAAAAPAEHAEVALDQETFERVLAELLEQGTDRRVAEGRARRAAMVAARSKAEGGS